MLQSRINGDSNLKAAGTTVSVGYDTNTGKFSITSTRYGSASNLSIASISSGLGSATGFGLQTGTDGVDVAGTIGGSEAEGSGRYLTGSGLAQDLKIEVLDGDADPSGATRGTVSYNRGFAYQLDQVLSKILASNGTIASRTDGIDRTIARLEEQEEKFSSRLESIEARYRSQFSALDSLVAGLKQTSSFLEQQLANLPSSS